MVSRAEVLREGFCHLRIWSTFIEIGSDYGNLEQFFLHWRIILQQYWNYKVLVLLLSKKLCLRQKKCNKHHYVRRWTHIHHQRNTNVRWSIFFRNTSYRSTVKMIDGNLVCSMEFSQVTENTNRKEIILCKINKSVVRFQSLKVYEYYKYF